MYTEERHREMEAQNRADKVPTTDKIVVVYGPMASGKTHHAEAIAAHFGCTNIVDNFASGGAMGGGATRGPLKIEAGTLLLVTAPEVSAYALRKVITHYNPDALNTLMAIVPISEALEAIAPTIRV